RTELGCRPSDVRPRPKRLRRTAYRRPSKKIRTASPRRPAAPRGDLLGHEACDVVVPTPVQCRPRPRRRKAVRMHVRPPMHPKEQQSSAESIERRGGHASPRPHPDSCTTTACTIFQSKHRLGATYTVAGFCARYANKTNQELLRPTRART